MENNLNMDNSTSLKAIHEILEQKKEIEDTITSIVDSFLRANPEVRDVRFTTSIYEQETMCGVYRDISIRIDLTI